jgi:hypothetical protein
MGSSSPAITRAEEEITFGQKKEFNIWWNERNYKE